MDLLRGTARKQGGKVCKGGQVFSSRAKERILSAAGYRSRFVLRRNGGKRVVADDDHRSSYSTRSRMGGERGANSPLDGVAIVRSRTRTR